MKRNINKKIDKELNRHFNRMVPGIYDITFGKTSDSNKIFWGISKIDQDSFLLSFCLSKKMAKILRKNNINAELKPNDEVISFFETNGLNRSMVIERKSLIIKLNDLNQLNPAKGKKSFIEKHGDNLIHIIAQETETLHLLNSDVFDFSYLLTESSLKDAANNYILGIQRGHTMFSIDLDLDSVNEFIILEGGKNKDHSNLLAKTRLQEVGDDTFLVFEKELKQQDLLQVIEQAKTVDDISYSIIQHIIDQSNHKHECDQFKKRFFVDWDKAINIHNKSILDHSYYKQKKSV